MIDGPCLVISSYIMPAQMRVESGIAMVRKRKSKILEDEITAMVEKSTHIVWCEDKENQTRRLGVCPPCCEQGGAGRHDYG